MKKIKILMRQLKRKWYDLRYLRARLTLHVAMEKADIAHRIHKVRYWVVPTPEGQLAVMNWTEAREWREINILPKAMRIGGLYNISIYWTAASTNPATHGFSLAKSHVDLKRYYNWWESTHK